MTEPTTANSSPALHPPPKRAILKWDSGIGLRVFLSGIAVALLGLIGAAVASALAPPQPGNYYGIRDPSAEFNRQEARMTLAGNTVSGQIEWGRVSCEPHPPDDGNAY